MILAVFDTNILVSAFRNPAGNEAAALRLVTRGEVRPCLSRDILAEYREVLLRPRFGFAAAAVGSLLQALEDVGVGMELPPSTISSPDPKDTMVIACAMAAGAEYLVTGNLVTGNRRHFPAPFYGTAEVVNARSLLDRIAAPA